ncbi:MAG TPA: site-specific integrase [Chthoniobacterales bacterium]
MRKTTTRLTKTKINGDAYYCVIWPKTGRGRNRQFFKSAGRGKDDPGKLEAETFLEQKLIEQQNYGTAGLSFTETQRSEYRECTEALKPFGKTIRDAVAFCLPHLQATNRTCTPSELAKELIKAKKADGASKRYLSDLKSRLGQFTKAFDGKKVAEITSTEVDDWLRSLGVAATTRNNFRRVLMVAFNYAKDRGYCAENPVKKTAKAKQIEGTVGILTVAQTASLLEASPPELVPFLAIGAFAGLRRAELEKLDWSDVDLDDSEITVTPEKAKSAQRRYVKIRENLSAWLRPFAKKSGAVSPSNYRELLTAARKSAGITDWPKNALRHGFASYSFAHFKDGPALTQEMGHTNANIVIRHYRKVVKAKDAAKYWEIKPCVKPANVITFGQAA